MKKTFRWLLAVLTVALAMFVSTPTVQAANTPTVKQVSNGSILYPGVSTKVVYTMQECSVWTVPDSNNAANRVKKVPANYAVTVYNQMFVSPIDGKIYYQTVKGKYIIAKYVTSSIGGTVSEGQQPEAVSFWGKTYNHIQTTSNGVYIYGENTPWPQYILDNIVAAGINPTDTAYEKVDKIYRYVGSVVSYDYNYYYNNRNNGYDDSTLGALTLRIAVCQGIANACQSMCLACGIETVVYGGWHNGDHAWNVACIDGVNYAFDATNYSVYHWDLMSVSALAAKNYETWYRYIWDDWTMGKTYKTAKESTAYMRYVMDDEL